MRVFQIIVAVATILLMLSTLVCGLYIGGGSAPDPASSAQFHMMLGILTAIFVFLSSILLIVKNKKQK